MLLPGESLCQAMQRLSGLFNHFLLSFSLQIFLMYVKSAQGLSRSNIITLQKCRNFTEFPGVEILWKCTVSA